MEGGILEGLTEGWKSGCYLVRMGGPGSILPAYRIVADA